MSSNKYGKECVITDMGFSRIFDLNKTYQKTKAATLPLKVKHKLEMKLKYFVLMYFFEINKKKNTKIISGVLLNCWANTNTVSKVTFGVLELFVLRY